MSNPGKPNEQCSSGPHARCGQTGSSSRSRTQSTASWADIRIPTSGQKIIFYPLLHLFVGHIVQLFTTLVEHGPAKRAETAPIKELEAAAAQNPLRAGSARLVRVSSASGPASHRGPRQTPRGSPGRPASRLQSYRFSDASRPPAVKSTACRGPTCTSRGHYGERSDLPSRAMALDIADRVSTMSDLVRHGTGQAAD